MQKVKVMVSALALTLFNSAYAQPDNYNGSSFSEVWNEMKSNPYSVLPDIPVGLTSFFEDKRFALLDDSRRTLDTRDDLRDRFDKRLHPTGVCMAGVWKITEESEYTGLFEKDTEVLAIARASSGNGVSELEGKFIIRNARGLGMAVKLFPTLNVQKTVETANFFTLDNNLVSEHYLDAELTNDILATIGLIPKPNGNPKLALPTTHNLTAVPVAPAGLAAFMIADETLNPAQTAWRSLWPVGEEGVKNNEEAVTPTWIRITGDPSVPRNDEPDYRNELDINNYPDAITFTIEVANEGTRPGRKEWEYIGTIDFSDTVASDSCDHRLHFAHPRFPENEQRCPLRDNGFFLRKDKEEDCLNKASALKWYNRDKSLR